MSWFARKVTATAAPTKVAPSKANASPPVDPSRGKRLSDDTAPDDNVDDAAAFDAELATLRARLAEATSAMEHDVTALHRAPLDATLASLGTAGINTGRGASAAAPTPLSSTNSQAGAASRVCRWMYQQSQRVPWRARASYGANTKNHGGAADVPKKRRVNVILLVLSAVTIATIGRSSSVLSLTDRSYTYTDRAAFEVAAQASLTPAEGAAAAATARAARASASVNTSEGSITDANHPPPPALPPPAPPGMPPAPSADANGTTAASSAFADPQNAEAATASKPVGNGNVEWLVAPHDNSKKLAAAKANAAGRVAKAGATTSVAAGLASVASAPPPPIGKIASAALAPYPPSPPPSRTCSPLNSFDFEVEACDGGCDAKSRKFHCKMCKCKLVRMPDYTGPSLMHLCMHALLNLLTTGPSFHAPGCVSF